jgi:hypothetical protein
MDEKLPLPAAVCVTTDVMKMQHYIDYTMDDESDDVPDHQGDMTTNEAIPGYNSCMFGASPHRHHDLDTAQNLLETVDLFHTTNALARGARLQCRL